MPDAVELIKTIKRAAIEAVKAEKPAEVCFGKVTSTAPLKILVEQKMILGEAQLVLCRNVTDFKLKVSVNCETETALDSHSHTLERVSDMNENVDLIAKEVNLSHVHTVTGSQEIIINNGLAVGDEVILIRKQGGQKYIVVDKIG